MIKKDNRKTHNFLGNKRGMDDEIRESKKFYKFNLTYLLS